MKKFFSLFCARKTRCVYVLIWVNAIFCILPNNSASFAICEQKGKHAFKFIVDDEWRFAPDQPTVADIEGRVNNFIDVSDFVGYTGEENFEANRMKVSRERARESGALVGRRHSL